MWTALAVVLLQSDLATAQDQLQRAAGPQSRRDVANKGTKDRPLSGVFNAAEVKSQIVGKMVQGDGIQWYYYPNGKYESDDGRVARGGTYAVRPDGRLCWDDRIGVSGCFQYYRQQGKLNVRRADPDNKFEIGPVTIGPLPK